ncbi:putative isxo2-like transposase domain protein [Trichonephila clavipes]|nr:putative isxo2-like transposase domain protein [Trichonephila clavipes]
MLGGPDVIVEIEESMLGERKYYRGKRVNRAWVFRGIERGLRECNNIISDCWKAYDCPEDKGFFRLSVNLSVNFKDPETEVHTNSIESSWRSIKKKFFTEPKTVTINSPCGVHVAQNWIDPAIRMPCWPYKEFTLLLRNFPK